MKLGFAEPDQAPRIVALHDYWREDWPGFTPESIEGVRSAITDDGTHYLLSQTGAVCLYADVKHRYGFLDFPYSSPVEARALLQAALSHLTELRVECPLPVERVAEAEILHGLDFRRKSTQRWMTLADFPDIVPDLPPGVSVCHPPHDEVEMLHDAVFRGYSLSAGWRTNPDIHPVIGLCASNVLLGYVMTEVHAGKPLLSELAVHPRQRRAGLGRALTLLGLEQLREAGARHVELLVNDSHDQHAPRLYESVGFQTARHLHRYELNQGDSA